MYEREEVIERKRTAEKVEGDLKGRGMWEI
jgi:hypothetical protein